MTDISILLLLAVALVGWAVVRVGRRDGTS